RRGSPRTVASCRDGRRSTGRPARRRASCRPARPRGPARSRTPPMWLAALAAPLPGPTEAPLERPGPVAGGPCQRITNLWATDHFCPTGDDKSNLRLSCAPGALFSRRSAPSGALAAPFGQVDDLLARVRGGVAGPLGGLPSQADARGEPGNKEEREGGD